MASVPKPPEGLADRIKADIPKYLKATEADRQRHFRSISLNMRVAASFLLLISALFVSIQLMSPEEEMKAIRVAKGTPANAVAPPTASMPELQRAIGVAPQEEVQVEIAQETPAAVAVTRTAANDAVEAPAVFASTRPARREDVPSVEDAERAIVSATEVAEIGATAGAVSAPEPAPAPVAPPPPPSAAGSSADAISATAEAPMIVRQRAVAKVAVQAAQPATVFGLSVDPDVFQRIKSSLEHGERPAAESVNIAALVNYFAGAPDRQPRRGVNLEVEGSPVPVGVEGRRGVVRFTIDTPAANGTPVARDAAIEVEINRTAVTSVRAIGLDTAAPAEHALPGGISVTGLYEVELRPGISARERVATVTLRYFSVAEGRERVVKKELHGRDFAGAWVSSSRRHRLASLGAIWGETLKGASSDTDIARRAEELAAQSPDDARARELSRLAAVSSRRTGS